MNPAPLSSGLRFDLAQTSGSARRVGKRLFVPLVIAAAVLLAPLLGIWQKNRVEATFRHNNRLRAEIAIHKDAIAREEIAIRRLAAFERIEPLAASRLGLASADPASKVYVPIAPPAAAEPERHERGLEFLVATARDGVDWLLPGNAATAGEER
jgi:hypothetical protein